METTSELQNFSAAVKNSNDQDSETVRQSYYQLAQLYRREQKPEESRAALDSFMKLKQQADARQAMPDEEHFKGVRKASWLIGVAISLRNHKSVLREPDTEL